MGWIETKAPLGRLHQGTSLLNFTRLLLTTWIRLGSGVSVRSVQQLRLSSLASQCC